jgi:hypothetical protein
MIEKRTRHGMSVCLSVCLSCLTSADSTGTAQERRDGDEDGEAENVRRVGYGCGGKGVESTEDGWWMMDDEKVVRRVWTGLV